MQGDYSLPNLILPTDEERPIGVWGQRRLNYLKHNRKVLYYNLLTSGKLHSHLADIEGQAQDLFSRLVKEYAEKEGITEQLKAADQMKWVQKKNNIRERVMEVVYKDVVFVWESENTTFALLMQNTTSSFNACLSTETN